MEITITNYYLIIIGYLFQYPLDSVILIAVIYNFKYTKKKEIVEKFSRIDDKFQVWPALGIILIYNCNIFNWLCAINFQLFFFFGVRHHYFISVSKIEWKSSKKSFVQIKRRIFG